MHRRLIIATFASNVHRLQQIIDLAVKYRRKVALSGRSMFKVVDAAVKIGELRIPEGVLIDIEKTKNLFDGELVIVSTGSQGEPMSALTRMASGEFNRVTIGENDTIIISANPIPGNEKMIYRVINNLYKKGARVVYESLEKIHVSGHACQEEHKILHSLLKPKFFIPVHGEYRMLRRHAQLAVDMGMPEDNAIILEMGQALELSEDEANITGPIPTGSVMVDGLGVGDVGNIVLRDRQHLSENGLLVVVVTLEKYTNELLAGPDIVSRGFVYVRESENLLVEAKTVVEDALDKCINRNSSDWGKIKNVIKDSLGEFVWRRTKRSPMILPIIVEVEP
jgi:ribonuclease J